MAAPGIAAGVAALTSSGTALLLPHGMLTTMFGVGGGGFVGYKVQCQTKGLTQFDYKRAVSLTHTNNHNQLKLHNVICLNKDGQRQLLDFSCHAYNLSSLIKFYDAFEPENMHCTADSGRRRTCTMATTSWKIRNRPFQLHGARQYRWQLERFTYWWH